jgi:hypothetical protein
LPVVDPTSATDVLLLSQVPPDVLFDKAVDAPIHTLYVPVLVAGKGLIVIDFVTKHPVGIVYVIVAVPAFVPVTEPDVDPTVTLPLVLPQVPPVVALVKVIVEPLHVLPAPDIAAGNGFTEATTDLAQPVGSIYETLAVPTPTPTIGIGETDTTDGLSVDQVPPAVALLSRLVVPRHRLKVPVMPLGSAFTVSGLVTKQPVAEMV